MNSDLRPNNFVSAQNESMAVSKATKVNSDQ